MHDVDYNNFFYIYIDQLLLIWSFLILLQAYIMHLIILLWLALDKDQKKLSIECTANQDPLIIKGANYVPLLGIDVWEHAYYLQYKNVRPDYLKYIWEVINWKYASEVYEKEYP
ncbi:putative superoxide dismutase [Rosa chinensis]|uniref:superoxide dismutase n=1 Tax=Rosa chinensis TaxID=74649 RepID=A0A2P6QKQ2_ROSCH|nr:putative superoxide dismutase [Rosa chinensis]